MFQEHIAAIFGRITLAFNYCPCCLLWSLLECTKVIRYQPRMQACSLCLNKLACRYEITIIGGEGAVKSILLPLQHFPYPDIQP